MTPPGSDASGAELSINELLARVDNDDELLRELLAIFKADSPQQLASLRGAVERADSARVASVAHTLKGMLSNLSAKPAAVSAAHLEQLAREGRASDFAAALATLEQQMQRLMPEIEACLPGNRS